jgi:hypothetical protein
MIWSGMLGVILLFLTFITFSNTGSSGSMSDWRRRMLVWCLFIHFDKWTLGFYG